MTDEVDSLSFHPTLKLCLSKAVLRFFVVGVQVRSEEPKNRGQKVMLAGDPEIETFEERMAHGVPIDQPVLEELNAIGRQFGLSLVPTPAASSSSSAPSNAKARL